MSQDTTNVKSTKESKSDETDKISESSKPVGSSSNNQTSSFGGTNIQILLKTLTHGDRKISCSSEMCVKDLKSQISREFPTQPKVDDQKLIHAGILLKDEVKLSTAFKMQIQFASSKGTSSEFIVHLVCTAKGSPIFKRHEANMSAASTSTSEAQGSGANSSPGVSNMSASNQNSNASGSRNANVSANFENTALQYDHVVNYINSNITKEQYSQMIKEMHEQHKKYYESVKDDVIENFKKQKFEPSSCSDLNSTINVLLGKKPINTSSWASNNESSGAQDQTGSTGSSPDVVDAGGDGERIPRHDNDEARAILEQRQRENAAVINAAGGFGGGGGVAQNEENGEENDWLTWLYRESRLVILLIILYSYSSLNRVLTVGVITALMYFFQRRWLPLFGRELMRRNDDNNNVNNNNENNQQNNTPPNNENADEENDNDNDNDGDPYDDFDDDNENRSRRNTESADASSTNGPETPLRARNNPPEAPTRMARVYSAMETLVVAVTTFFVSLFPIELRQQQNV